MCLHLLQTHNWRNTFEDFMQSFLAYQVLRRTLGILELQIGLGTCSCRVMPLEDTDMCCSAMWFIPLGQSECPSFIYHLCFYFSYTMVIKI